MRCNLGQLLRVSTALWCVAIYCLGTWLAQQTRATICYVTNMADYQVAASLALYSAPCAHTPGDVESLRHAVLKTAVLVQTQVVEPEKVTGTPVWLHLHVCCDVTG